MRRYWTVADCELWSLCAHGSFGGLFVGMGFGLAFKMPWPGLGAVALGAWMLWSNWRTVRIIKSEHTQPPTPE